eukprot:CAMPEP_0168516108 /NCGR_PEP_ID=MMETSP0405-20121227/5211_1 /TAXON_ID=498012 /ORGANISM="Trichosphaerium sp, Strain Am-I-7 wt" /LENGTH=284 /DNA_ID=CAMNT_0008535767 /DNA_START=220 /DNA_END=1074 /DNA_ORIENTATION=-
MIPELRNVTSIAAGGSFSLALTASEEVYSWGHNSCGQLGIGDRKRRLQPTKVPKLKLVIEISAGFENAHALLTNGIVYSWGKNLNYPDAARTVILAPEGDILIPTKIVNLIDVWTVSAGHSHTIAITGDSVMYGWGKNNSNQVTGTAVVCAPQKINIKAKIMMSSFEVDEDSFQKSNNSSMEYSPHGSREYIESSGAPKKTSIETGQMERKISRLETRLKRKEDDIVSICNRYDEQIAALAETINQYHRKVVDMSEQMQEMRKELNDFKNNVMGGIHTGQDAKK